MDDDLATALAAERAIVHRAVRGAVTIDGGWLVRHPPLSTIWHLNRVHLSERPLVGWSADDVAAVADRCLPDVAHRRVTLDDTALADALWPALQARGWRRERSVVMVRPGTASASVHPGTVPTPAGARATPGVRELDEPALAGFQPLAFADDAAVTAISSDLPGQLAEAQAALRAATSWRAFAAGSHVERLVRPRSTKPAPPPGSPPHERHAERLLRPQDVKPAPRSLPETVDTDTPTDTDMPASTATLYLDPDVCGRRVAFIDQVATLRPYRERGLARAVMVAALQAAACWGADLVALFADADDWPQVFYASLGFRTVGRQTVFHRAPAS